MTDESSQHQQLEESREAASPQPPSRGVLAWVARAYSKAFLRFLIAVRADPGPPRAPRDDDVDGGRWPSTREQFLWDLAPADVAPNSDGVIQPDWGPPAWTQDVNDPEEVARMFEAARTYRKDADETTRNLELKAARLATVLVALLTANVALIVYEITRLGASPSTTTAWLTGAGVTFGLLAASYLVVGLSRAIDADQRMGITNRSGLADVAHDTKQAMYDEAIGYAISDWTRKNKASRLLDARSAVSRSLLFLLISAGIAVLMAFTTTLSGGTVPLQHNGARFQPHGDTHRKVGTRARDPRSASPSPR